MKLTKDQSSERMGNQSLHVGWQRYALDVKASPSALPTYQPSDAKHFLQATTLGQLARRAQKKTAGSPLNSPAAVQGSNYCHWQ